MTLVQVPPPRVEVTRQAPELRRSPLALLTVWRWLHWRHLDRRRSLAVVFGLGLGTAAILAVLILHDSIAAPFQALDRHIHEVNPDAVVVRSRIGNWMSDEDVRLFPDEFKPVPVAGGFADLMSTGTETRVGALVIGSDCRMERLVGDIDCEKELDQQLDEVVEGSGPPVALTSRLAHELAIQPGDTLVFPGGQTAHVGSILTDERLNKINSGFLAIGEVLSVAELFGHPDEVSAVYLATPADDVVAQVEKGLSGRAEVIHLNGGSRYVVPALENLRRFLILGGMVAAALAVFLGASVFVTAAVERRRQMATVETLGQSRPKLIAGFMVEGAILGVLGAIVAIPLGILLGRWLTGIFTGSLLDGTGVHLTYEVPRRILLTCAVLAVVLGMVAAVVPVVSVFRQSAAQMLAHNRTREYAQLPQARWGLLFVGLGAVGVALMYGSGSGQLHENFVYPAHALFIGGAIGATVVLAPRVVLAMPRPTRGRRLHLASSFVQTDLGLAPWRTGFTVAILSAGVSLLVGLNGLLVSLQGVVESGSAVLEDRLLLLGRAIGEPTEYSLDPDLEERVAGLAGVENVTPLAETTLRGDMTVFAYPAESTEMQFLENLGLDSAKQVAALREGRIFLSRFAAERMGVAPGETVVVPARAGPASLEVAAVGDLMLGSDNGYGKVIVADFDLAQELWGVRETSLLVTAEQGISLANLAQTLPRPGRVHLYDRATFTAAASRHIQRTFNPVLAVAWMMLVIAAIGVLLMLLLTLWDRRVQRAALRQLGMSYPQELWALIGDAAMLTFLAILFGTVGGLVYGWGNTLAGPVLFSMSPSFVIPWGAIGMAAVVAAVVCFVGALLPIVTGKRFDTLAALRCD